MSQKNLIYDNGKRFAQTDPYADDLTLRSFSGRLFLINSHSSTASDVFRVRNLAGTDVALISNQGDATLQDVNIKGDLVVEGTSIFKSMASGYFDINSGFKIAGVSTQNSVTANNLSTLTNGGNADSLHKHGSLSDIIVDDSLDLWTAYARAVDGNTIYVTKDQSTSIQRVLDKKIEIVFKPNIKVVCSTPLAYSVIKFGKEIITKNFQLVLTQSGTIATGIEFSDYMSYHDNIKVIQNSALGVLTNAYIINLGSKGNYAKGVTYQLLGNISNALVDNSGNVTNDVEIRAFS